jgi:hypothetical protein
MIDVILQGLAQMHECDFVHGDMKPKNLQTLVPVQARAMRWQCKAVAQTAVEFRPLEGPASEAADCHGNQDGHLKDESDNDMSGDIGASAAANDSITVNKEPLVQTS